MKLNDLSDNEGATKNRTRVGRGIGSGKGKTGGRGVKGQKSRSGVSINGFEGGQMPLYRRLPKRGFTNHQFRKEYAIVNLSDLQRLIDAKKLDPKKPVTGEALIAAGLIHKVFGGVKVLAKGELSHAVTIEAVKASQAAVDAVAKAGGSINLPAEVEKPASRKRRHLAMKNRD